MISPPLARAGALLELRDVRVTYPGPPPVPALRQCDFVVGRGEYVTIVGPSGSGKSTLLNVLGLLARPTHGDYLLNGVCTAELGDAQITALRAYQIGFVFQSFHLLPHRSAEENVMLAQLYRAASGDARRNAAREALARVGLAARVGHLPNQLSGGEQQRVAIARAIAGQPAILLCDEPTGNLDSATAEQVLGIVDDLHGDGLTVLLITHDPDVAARGERTIEIRDGVVTEVAR